MNWLIEVGKLIGTLLFLIAFILLGMYHFNLIHLIK